MATFTNLVIDAAGSYTVAASDGSLPGATSNSFSISAAAASKVVYGVQPGNVTAGVADSPSIVVDVEDQFGNIVIIDSSNVTLVVASGPGSLSGTLTMAASGGVATFSNVKLNTAGSYTLTASDGSLTSATSSSFAVSAASASKVVYGQQPSNATAGVADSPSIVVDVEDPFGNIVTSDSSNVTLTVASGLGSASGTLTVAASGGIATFGNVKLNTAGNYTLTASDGALSVRHLQQLHGLSGRCLEGGVWRSAQQCHRWRGRQPVDCGGCGGPVRQHRDHRQFQCNPRGGHRPWHVNRHIDRSGQRRRGNVQ